LGVSQDHSNEEDFLHGLDIRQFHIAGVALSSMLAACGRADKAPQSDSAKPIARSYPGALTKPIDDYSGDEFYDLTHHLKYAGSHERVRKCNDSPDCEGPAPKRKTIVHVSAVATQDSLGAANTPPFGVVYVRAINRGDAREARYGFRPGKSLRYYMIVHRDSGDALRWRLEELETATPRRHLQIGAGAFTSCGHTKWKPGARADFKTCDAAERGDSVVSLPLALQIPLWIECAAGCCTF
jgi:hypothetical protein